MGNSCFECQSEFHEVGVNHNLGLTIIDRTPILSSGMTSAHAAFEAAPKDITSEYDPSFEQAHIDLMNQASEVYQFPPSVISPRTLLLSLMFLLRLSLIRILLCGISLDMDLIF